MADNYKEAVTHLASADKGYYDNEPEKMVRLAEAQVYATLAVVDELRKHQEDTTLT